MEMRCRQLPQTLLLLTFALLFTEPAVRAEGLRVVHSFSGVDGSGPDSRLVLAPDGNFYGPTNSGGAYGHGVIFRMTPAGDLTVMHSFHGSDGAAPQCGLTLGSDGNLYGSTADGGLFNRGVVFSCTLAGTVTILHQFNGIDGASPTEMVQAADGTLYGTTQHGGVNASSAYLSGNGTIFKISPGGQFTSLYQFTNSDGQAPNGPLALGDDGNYYGTVNQALTTDFGGALFSALLPTARLPCSARLLMIMERQASVPSRKATTAPFTVPPGADTYFARHRRMGFRSYSIPADPTLLYCPA